MFREGLILASPYIYLGLLPDTNKNRIIGTTKGKKSFIKQADKHSELV